MKWRKGPRPWSVHLFAVILIGAGLWNFVPLLWLALDEADRGYRIALVSVLSAQFSIVVIPVIAIWALASRVAKWLFTLLSIGSFVWLFYKMLTSDFALEAMIWMLGLGTLTHGAVILLFVPSARRWFDAQRTQNVEVFK
jgi:hypothetical protein